MACRERIRVIPISRFFWELTFSAESPLCSDREIFLALRVSPKGSGLFFENEKMSEDWKTNSPKDEKLVFVLTFLEFSQRNDLFGMVYVIEYVYGHSLAESGPRNGKLICFITTFSPAHLFESESLPMSRKHTTSADVWQTQSRCLTSHRGLTHLHRPN